MALTKIEASNIAAGAVASSGFSDAYSTVASSVVYTVPTDITKLLVFITGGGGGGAGGDNTTGKPGSGGLGATTVIARVNVVPTDTITIEVGAGGNGGAEGVVGADGGNSTFTHTSGSGSGSMSTITAPGGKGGKWWASSATPTAGTVGANNEGISILGGYGGCTTTTGEVPAGASCWGGGGLQAQTSVHASIAGQAYGSGGGSGNNTTGGVVGADGAVGVCFILEYK